MKIRFDVILSGYFILVCSAGLLTQAAHLPSQATGQGVSHGGHGGSHKGHGHAELGKKDELEVELLKLKHYGNEDKADPVGGSSSSLSDTSRGGQPEYANEDLEEELTEVRPLDIALHILELKTVHPYATSTMQTSGQSDFEELTTVASRTTELPPTRKPEGNMQDEDDHSYGGDGSNPSTTEYYTEREEINEINDDDGDDDDDDDYYSDDDGYDSEDSGGDHDDDDDIDDDDDDDDDDNDETETKKPKVNYEGKRRVYGKKNKERVTSDETTFQSLKKPTNFEDSVEHGRQRKEDDWEDFPASGTRKEGEGSNLTLTGAPRSALERDLVTFLRNESPEAEDQEARNVTKRIRKEKKKERGEANSYAARNLQEIRELEKKRNVPQKLVDAVSPEADENLLELMVHIAENPTEWQLVHQELQQLDQDLATSRVSLQGTESLGKSDSGTEETNVNVLSNKSKEKARHRKHQQADKKKKKKKQKQKGKLKAKDEKAQKLEVKGEEEVRRDELQKAGVLLPLNVLFKGNEKGKIFKETSSVKGYLTETLKEPLKSHIKGTSVQNLESENTRDKNQSIAMNSDKEIKGNEGKEWPIRTVQKYKLDHMSSIESAIAYLSQPEQVLSHLKTNRLPIPTKLSDVPRKHDWPDSLNDNGLDQDPTNAWSKHSADWSRNKNKWLGSLSNPVQDMANSQRKPDDWANIPSISESTYRETGRNDLPGIHGFSRSVSKEVPENRLPHFGASLGKDIPGNKAFNWRELQNNISSWPGLNPKEERRYFSGDQVYSSPNTGWPRFSVESLKHGNLAGNVKTWPDLPMDQSMSSNKDGYSIGETSDNGPNFPLETGISIQSPVTYSWPKYTDEIINRNSITIGKINSWSKPSLDPSAFKQRELTTNTWSHMQPPHQKPLSAIDRAIAHHTKEASSSKQWPHFAYHRVTSSPQILAQQQKEAQQRARHRSAYIAVSVIAPPGKSKGFNKTQSRTNGSVLPKHNEINEPSTEPSVTRLPDKIDELLVMRSEKQKFPEGGDLLEEQLVDLAVAGQQRSAVPWSHTRHLNKIQEQLKTLSAMGKKLCYHWLEKERFLQILRDGGKSGSGFFRSLQDDSTGQETATVTTTTTIDPPNHLITPHTTHPTSTP